MSVLQTGSAARGAARPFLMSKSEFAARRGVQPSAVSNWIATGRLTSEALVGTGRYAQIDVAEAERQLAATLDPAQQLGRPAPALTPAAVPTQPAELPLRGNGDAERYAAARADQAEMAAERERRRLLAEQGHYTEAEAARAAWSRQVAGLVAALEQWMPRLAETVALELGCDRAAARSLLLRELRAFRGAQAKTLREAMAGEPELIGEAA